MAFSERVTATTNKRRSERVVLIVPIVLSVKAPDGRITIVDARTQVVNAHGGLLKTVRLHLVAGQQIILTHPKSGVTVGCRVLSTEQKEPQGLSVAFEFDEPAPFFWPIVFPPNDWAP